MVQNTIQWYKIRIFVLHHNGNTNERTNHIQKNHQIGRNNQIKIPLKNWSWHLHPENYIAVTKKETLLERFDKLKMFLFELYKYPSFYEEIKKTLHYTQRTLYKIQLPLN